MIQVFSNNYICWDLETDGFDKINGHILEVAVAVVRDGKVVEKWSELINHDIDIDERATAVHGITREMCKEKGKKLKPVLMKLLSYIYGAEVHITHNGTKFDIPFLISSLGHANVAITERMLTKSHIDTAALYKGREMGIAKSWNESWHEHFVFVLNQRVTGLKFNVKHCCEELGIPLEGVQQHRALADVLLTNQIYQKLVS